MKSHAQCKRTEKINRQTEKRLNEYFGMLDIKNNIDINIVKSSSPYSTYS